MESALRPSLAPTAASPSGDRAQDVWLKDARWDRTFILGGALLVPVPIVVYYLCRALGLDMSGAEDVVTAMVMVFVGGPHVFATYTRTWFNPDFPRRDRLWFLLSFPVIAIVAGAAIASAFFDHTILGFPPTQFVMTFFFFWAGVHIVHQASYCAACYEEKQNARLGERPGQRLWSLVDYALMLGCLYPMSLFRMSMVDPSSPGQVAANPDALATRLLVDLGATPGFVDAYVFRIGRVAPILPTPLMHEALWISVTLLFVGALTLFVVKTRRELRTGTLNRPRFQLVAATAAVGFAVPWFPNLDSAFQGFNAWHSFQYLGLLWLMNRRSYESGEIRTRFVQRLAEPGSARRYYGTGLGVTLGMIGLFFAFGWLIQVWSGGEFLLFGHGEPKLDPATGAPLYRPGALLLAYYMLGFGFLLVHYLHDGVFFFRTRYVVGGSTSS
ncbi:MAG: hypothetical protein JNM84_25060 [Planctomycetes bacterium]|nr:hypothetical protein [Planctomycetota bacterium]